MNISWWVSHWASWAPGKTALRFEGASISYAELERRVARATGFLVARGVARGDRVAYLGPNCPEVLELLFASARIGAVFVPLSARMPPAELSVFVAQTEPALVVAEESFGDAAVASARAAAPRDVIAFGAEGLVSHAADATPVTGDPALDPATPVLIAYTSGTSGAPKGALLTHETLTANALNSIAAFGITDADEILTVAPLFQVGGLNIQTTPALRAGATVTLHRRFEPTLALEAIAGVPATLFVAPPAMSLAMTGHPAWSTTELESLRCLATGSMHVPEAVLRPWAERGVPVVQVYGLTETGPVATVVPLHEAGRKAATAGKPALHTQVAVVGPSGRSLPPLESGEVVLRGANVMQGYWRNADATRDAFADGWFRSGDVGFLDEEGFLHIVDRLKDIIIVGGSNVYPADVERVLAESRDVAEAAVVARPDATLGEVPVAFVVPAPGRTVTRENVLSLFEGRLAEYKHPHDVVFLDQLPRTAIGKVRKEDLRARARSR